MVGPFFSTPATARQLGVSVRTLARYIDRGLIRPTRFPPARGERSLKRFSQQAIEAFLKSGYRQVP